MTKREVVKTVTKQGKPAAKREVKTTGPMTKRMPHFAIEWSRKQVLCRTGRKGPGESFPMKFGDGSVDATIKKARAWVSEKKKELGWE